MSGCLLGVCLGGIFTGRTSDRVVRCRGSDVRTEINKPRIFACLSRTFAVAFSMVLGRGGMLFSFLPAVGLRHWVRRDPDELADDVSGLAGVQFSFVQGCRSFCVSLVVFACTSFFVRHLIYGGGSIPWHWSFPSVPVYGVGTVQAENRSPAPPILSSGFFCLL